MKTKKTTIKIPVTEFHKKLTEASIKWTDRNGTIIEKIGNPVHSILAMKHEKDDINVYFRVMSSAQGNGSAHVRIWKNKKLIFDAGGSYFDWCTEVKTDHTNEDKALLEFFK